MGERYLMSKARRAKRSSLSAESRVTCLRSSLPSWQKLPKPFPSGREIEYWALVRAVDFQKSEVERLKHALRFQQWAIGELIDYLDAELRPGQLSAWQRYRRLLSRLRG